MLAPKLLSAATNLDGTKVILTYSEPLSATTAPNTAFVVKVGATENAVTTAVVNGSAVELTLTTPIAAGATELTVGCTAPTPAAGAINAAIQDIAGNDAIALTNQAVIRTNNTITVESKETPAPIVYLTESVNQLDSITTLLKYNGTVQNSFNYQNLEPIQWRTRSSSSDPATDLTLGSAVSTQVNLRGVLNENTQSEFWYKINLTDTSSLKILDSSVDYGVVQVAVFDIAISGKSFAKSVYEPHSQLSTYSNLPVRNYFVRIDKSEASSDSRLSQAINFDVKITTNTNDYFIVPQLVSELTVAPQQIELLIGVATMRLPVDVSPLYLAQLVSALQ